MTTFLLLMTMWYSLPPEWERFKPCGLEHTLCWHDWFVPGEYFEDARGWIQLDANGRYVPEPDLWALEWRPHLCECQPTWPR